MEVASLSKLSIDLYHATRLHIPQGSGPAFRSQRRENLKFPPRVTFVMKELYFLEFQIIMVPTNPSSNVFH
jgi:hypothetical protein